MARDSVILWQSQRIAIKALAETRRLQEWLVMTPFFEAQSEGGYNLSSVSTNRMKGLQSYFE